MVVTGVKCTPQMNRSPYPVRILSKMHTTAPTPSIIRDCTRSRFQKTKQQKIEGTLAALIAIQKGGVNTDSEQIDNWLQKANQKDAARLYEEIEIDPNEETIFQPAKASG